MGTGETDILPTLRERRDTLWRLDVGGGSIVGGGHRCCDDYAEIGKRADLAVVCDGMGGPPKGDLAAEVACKVTADEYEGGLTLRAAIHSAGEAVGTLGRWLRCPGMGCTIAAVAIEGGTARVAWLGDTEVYRLRDGELQDLTSAEHGREPGTNRLLECLCDGMPSYPHELLFDVAEGDAYLLCTDGLWTELGMPGLLDAIGSSDGTAAGMASSILGQMQTCEGKPEDDATLVILRMLKGEGSEPVGKEASQNG